MQIKRESMIDDQGFRPNVGIVVCNQDDKVLWCQRTKGQNSWQFPQGGIQRGETPEQAMYRELYEEVGLDPEKVVMIGCTKSWLRYRLPKRFIRASETPIFVGQKQIWFLLRLIGSESEVSLSISCFPEFNRWRWVSYWYPISGVVDFKRAVYRQALFQLAKSLFSPRDSGHRHLGN